MLHDLETAWDRLTQAAPQLPTKLVPVNDSHGRVLATHVYATADLPPFDNSAMDGYAIRSEDTHEASVEQPVGLRLAGEVFAGDDPAGSRVLPGTAMRIMTGAQVPDGADCVLMLENARLRDETVWIEAPVTPGRHIRQHAEDVAQGDLIAATGTRVSVGMVGLLASSGLREVEVRRRPRVAIIVTGSELTAAGATLAQGAIYDSNGAVLRSLVDDAGCELTTSSTVGDDPDAIRAAMLHAQSQADLVVMSGGVSVGRRDYVKKVADEIGAERLFWRVRMKPGKPLLACKMPTGAILLGLPGNPVSCLAGWVLFASPLIAMMSGQVTEVRPRAVSARLGHDASGDPSRVRFATGTLGPDESGQLVTNLTSSQGSAMIRSMADGSCLVRLEEGQAYAAGDLVSVVPYNDVLREQ